MWLRYYLGRWSCSKDGVVFVKEIPSKIAIKHSLSNSSFYPATPQVVSFSRLGLNLVCKTSKMTLEKFPPRIYTSSKAVNFSEQFVCGDVI